MLTAEQILAAHKANVETLFGLTTKAFEGVEKLVELNVTASKAALTEALRHRPSRPERQGRPGTAGPASRHVPASGREDRCLQPSPV
jgi:hypothetical protein